MKNIVTLIEGLKVWTQAKDDKSDIKAKTPEHDIKDEMIVEEQKVINSDDELEAVLNQLLDEKYESRKSSEKREQWKIAHAKIAKETSWIVSETRKQSFIKVRWLDSASISPNHHRRNSSSKLSKLVSIT